MYGLNAINTHNGWAISVVGISIVFNGLVLLSLAISQIHKLLSLWENRNNISLFTPKTVSDAPPPVQLTPVQKEVTRQFKLLASTLEPAFSLPRLLKLADISGIDRPHAHLAMLLEQRIITADEQGYHSWDTARYTTLIS